MLDPRRVREELEAAQRNYGGRDWPSTFRDRLTAPLPGFRDIARIMRQGGFGVKDLSDAANIPVSPQERLPEVHSGQTVVTWIGHATYVVQIGGRTILTHPGWSRENPRVQARPSPPGGTLAGGGDRAPPRPPPPHTTRAWISPCSGSARTSRTGS